MNPIMESRAEGMGPPIESAPSQSMSALSMNPEVEPETTTVVPVPPGLAPDPVPDDPREKRRKGKEYAPRYLLEMTYNDKQ
jgi:hypothetical protein